MTSRAGRGPRPNAPVEVVKLAGVRRAYTFQPGCDGPRKSSRRRTESSRPYREVVSENVEGQSDDGSKGGGDGRLRVPDRPGHDAEVAVRTRGRRRVPGAANYAKH